METVIEEQRYNSAACVIILGILILGNYTKEAGGVTLYNNERIPAVFVFGDSVVDTGNNNNIITSARCNYPPYGRDFMGGKPTGRFSNGKVPSDLIAEAFGVKDTLPPYRDSSLQIDDLLTGVCFASGGNGFDPITSALPPAFSLPEQLENLKEYKERITRAVGEERSETIISKGIFVLCTGSNDILSTYFSTPLRSRDYDLSSYIDFLLDLFAKFIQEVYGVGGRRFGIFSLPPLGCVPSQRTVRGGLQRKCFEEANAAAILYNSKLKSAILSLNSTFSDANIMYIDVFNPFLSITQNPSKYGFEIANKGCCGTGNIEVTYLCTRLQDPFTCKDDTKYVFWDSYHPTEKAYRALINIVLNQ